MSKTLLSYTQDILDLMVSDEVNSISDTAEATIVAKIVLAAFKTMVSTRYWPHLNDLFQLDAFSDSETPTHFKVPDSIKKVTLVQYNKIRANETRIRYEEIRWKEPDAFLRFINPRNNDNTNVTAVSDPTGIKLMIRNDCQPQYYTSFDDENIVMDAYDSSIDSTLQSSKTMAWGSIKPAFTLADDYSIDLPEEAESTLLEEALSTAQYRINTFNDVKAEQQAVKGHRWLSRNARKMQGGIKYPNYGRQPSGTFNNGSSNEATFRKNN